MLRYESPSQHTARLAPSDRELGGKLIQKRQAVIAVMAAANRDPERFPDPDRFDITRKDNRHLAFGYAAHFCFGAPLARVEGQVVLGALLRRLSNLALVPESVEWRSNLGLRGLKSLKVKFGAQSREKLPTQPREASFVQARPTSSQGRCPYEVQDSGAKQDLIRKYLQSRTSDKSQPSVAVHRTKQDPTPLSFAQEQIWLHYQFAKDLYNESV